VIGLLARSVRVAPARARTRLAPAGTITSTEPRRSFTVRLRGLAVRYVTVTFVALLRNRTTRRPRPSRVAT
jgi:hypothetical protein